MFTVGKRQKHYNFHPVGHSSSPPERGRIKEGATLHHNYAELEAEGVYYDRI
jgi:hypothetical protein